jgi:tetratricopeptide (TPR) repeat protein
LTCDCSISDWFDKYAADVLLTASRFDCSAANLDFLKAFIYFYSFKYGAAFNSINCFIDFEPSNELGYYLKGKILLSLNKFSEALENFEKALELKRTYRTLYRIGRTKEQYFNSFGLGEMYESIILNPSSGCAHWHFAEYAMKRKLFETELSDYQKLFDEDDELKLFSLRLGKDIELAFAEKGKYGISDYMLSLEKVMNSNEEYTKVYTEKNKLRR